MKGNYAKIIEASHFFWVFFLLIAFLAVGSANGKPIENNRHYEQFLLDSLNINFISNWPFGPYDAVAYDSIRNLIFMGSGGGICIYDATHQANPILISDKIRNRGFVEEIVYDETTQRLYVADWIALEIWDVADPENPNKLGFCAIASLCTRDLAISGSYAYVAGGGVGLYIIDISDPCNPFIVYVYELTDVIFGVDVIGSYAYLASDYYFMRIADISDPANPYEIGYYHHSRRCCGVRVKAGYAYMTSYNLSFFPDANESLLVIDVHEPANPYLCGSCPAYGKSEEFYITGNYAYLTHGGAGLRIFDISDPSNPFEVGGCAESATSVTVSGQYAWVSAGMLNGLRIIDISNPEAPFQICQIKTIHGSGDICVRESHVYSLASPLGIRILDISNIGYPFVVDTIGNLRGTLRFEIVDSLAYITTEWGEQDYRLIIVNLSAAGYPIIGSCFLSYVPISGGFFIEDSFAYICGGNWKLKVLDISDPTDPREISSVGIGEKPRFVFVDNDMAYVTTGDLDIVDIADPLHPQYIGHCDTPGETGKLGASGNYAYVADYNAFLVIDVSNPSSPEIIASFDSLMNIRGLDLDDGLIYLTSDQGGNPGLHVFDVSTPNDPQEIGYYWAMWAGDVDVSNDFMFSSCGLVGMQIYQFYGAGVEEEPEEPLPIPTALKLLQNPVTGSSIKLMLTTNNSNDCALGLYNILGQEVKVFDVENLFVGKNYIDLSVSQIPNGIYFLRMNNGSCIQSEKVVILK